MKSSYVRSFVLMAIVTTTLSMTHSASAQQRRGGRGGGGRGVLTRLRLASLEKVQSELKLTDEQKKLATEINEKLRADLTEMFQANRDGGGDRGAMQEKMTKINSEASAKLMAKMDDAQKKRLTEVFVQVNGMNSLRDKEVAAALKITDEQKKGLTEVQAKNREAAQGLRDLSADERQEAREKMTKEANERFMAVLTGEQKETFGKLKGKAIEIDMTQLRGRRGGRGAQGRGGQGGAGRAQRPE
ncbi:hypothetical protein ACFL2H_04560 [Planctomycetota bacterium]